MMLAMDHLPVPSVANKTEWLDDDEQVGTPLDASHRPPLTLVMEPMMLDMDPLDASHGPPPRAFRRQQDG
eukprot:597596-Prorocentrum_minimum.AAC.1